MKTAEINFIKVAAHNAIIALNDGDTQEALALLGEIAELAAKRDESTADNIADHDHASLVALAEIAEPNTRVGRLLENELRKRGIDPANV